jgi:hypothetical protein
MHHLINKDQLSPERGERLRFGRSATPRDVEEVRTVPPEVGKVVWLPQLSRTEMGRVPLVSVAGGESKKE